MPYVNVHIDLDDFDDDDLIEELESRGYTCNKDSAAGMGSLEHVEHMIACGLIAEAREEALDLVGKAIGRTLQ